MIFFLKQKTAYEMRISDWSSDVCSSDLIFLIIGIGKERGRVVDVEDIEIGRRRRQREGRGEGEGGDDARRERLAVEAAQAEIENPGADDAAHRPHAAAGGPVPLRPAPQYGGDTRTQHHRKKPKHK